MATNAAVPATAAAANGVGATGDALAAVGGVDRQLVMQCFHENYRRCGTGDPSVEGKKTCGCTLANGRVPHHSSMEPFVEKLRAWAAKRPTPEERYLITRLSQSQGGKKHQERVAVAAVLAANGVCILEKKTKYAKAWYTAEEKAQEKALFLQPNTILGWVPKEAGGAEGGGMGVPGNGAAAATLADGAAMGVSGNGGGAMVSCVVVTKGLAGTVELKVVAESRAVLATVRAGSVEANAGTVQPMDDETAAKRTCDAWFNEALDDASIPHLEKTVATNVEYPQDVEARVGKLQRQQGRLNSDIDQLRTDQLRVSHYTLHEQERAAVARTNYEDAIGTVNCFLKMKKQVEEELSRTGLHLFKQFHLFKPPTSILQAQAMADCLRSIKMSIEMSESKPSVNKIRTEEVTMNLLRTKVERLDKLLTDKLSTNAEQSFVSKEEALVQKQQAELQLSEAKERRDACVAEYMDECDVRREELARELSRNEDEFRRSIHQDCPKQPKQPKPVPAPGEPGHEAGMRALERHVREERSRSLGELTREEIASLERNRQERFELDAEMFVLGGKTTSMAQFEHEYKHALEMAVDSHPDVLAAKASMVPNKECNSAQLEFFAAVAALDRAERHVLANVESPPVDECTRVLGAYGPFDVFGVPRDANEADVRARYKELALALHPDKAGDAGEEAMKRVNEAKAVLEDPEQRAAYDAKYPLGGFMTTLTHKLANALYDQEKVRRERLSYALQVRINLEKLLPSKGAATNCTPPVSKQLLKAPQIQLLRTLPVKLDTFGRNTASVNSFEADDTSTRVAVLNCLIGTFQVELPFEVVTLVDDRALLFPQLASAVHGRLDKIIRPRVVEMSDAALAQAIEEARTSPLVTALWKQYNEQYDQLSSDQRSQITYQIENESKRANATLPRELRKLLEDDNANEDALRKAWRKHLNPKLKQLLPKFPCTYKLWARLASQTGPFVEKDASPAQVPPNREEPQSKWPRLM